MHIPEFFQIAFWSAMFAIVWQKYLTPSGKIFDWFHAWFQKHITRNDKINTLLFECSSCLAAQMCFWFHIYDFIFLNRLTYGIGTMFMSIAASMYLASILIVWITIKR